MIYTLNGNKIGIWDVLPKYNKIENVITISYNIEKFLQDIEYPFVSPYGTISKEELLELFTKGYNDPISNALLSSYGIYNTKEIKYFYNGDYNYRMIIRI